MKKTPQQIIAGFQQLKHNFIKKEAKRLGVKLPTYHTRKDHEELLGLSTAKATKVLNRLSSGHNLSVDNCSFCLLMIAKSGSTHCKQCNYGKRHGICTKAESDVDFIIDFLGGSDFQDDEFRQIQDEYLIKHRGKI